GDGLPRPARRGGSRRDPRQGATTACALCCAAKGRAAAQQAGRAPTPASHRIRLISDELMLFAASQRDVLTRRSGERYQGWIHNRTFVYRGSIAAADL